MFFFLNRISRVERDGETIPGIKSIPLLRKANAAGGCRAINVEGGIA